MEVAEKTGRLAFHSLLVEYLGEVLMLADRPGDARSVAERALTLARDRGERGIEAWTLRLMAEIASASSSSGKGAAEDFYKDAMALANDLGMRPLVARCHLGLGQTCRHARAPGDANEHFSEAASRFRELEMSSWLDRAEQELKQPL